MTRHGELGTALHRWRDRIPSAETGPPADASRESGAAGRAGEPKEAGEPDETPGAGGERPAGLGLTELARLTGLSMDYLGRLEEGRATSPSAQVLASLARALRLSEDERRHLFLLAGQSPPALGRVSELVPPSVRRLLGRLGGTPVGVYDASWNLLTWNPLWAALVGDPSGIPARGRNAAWQHFTGQPSRVTHTPEQEAGFEAALVADLRAATVHYPTDVRLRFLIGELRRASARFGALWNSRIAGSHSTGISTVLHPDVGPLTVDRDTFTVPGCDLRISAYSAAPGSEAAEKLRLLDVIGTDIMTAPAAPPAPFAEDAEHPEPIQRADHIQHTEHLPHAEHAPAAE
ncbi:helix-turn-helix transcriptional regulator [Streptomyces paludis]|uniref:XRE family transcriptional regulator n=1 Tax=Streptomyces paludis TaxID=2282738 RepID=A0A345HX74_9ACTN|nr:helix-turn-helix transcriptional regulator [Streptomyces paludis]AXG81298.1 XRE family transcriptional regulator [Streptomyces paludis]